MSERDDRLVALTSLRPFGSELAQVGAVGTLDSLGARTDRGWTFRPTRVARNLVAAHSDLLQAARLIEGELSDDVLVAARVVAQGWEDLARISSGPDAVTARVNAALNYEIAGYQANAACLARQFVAQRFWTTDVSLVGLASAFLQRLYMRVRDSSEVLVREPDLSDVVDRDELVRRAAIAVAASGIDEAARSLMTGDREGIIQANVRLDAAEQGLAQIGDMLLGSVVAGLRRVLPVMEARSTWRHLRSLSTSARWSRYLLVLGRGVGAHVLDARSISELWPSQVAAIEGGLLSADSRSLVVRMPTSAGKTRVAEMALIHALAARPGSKCVYVAPFRALAAEVETSLAQTFSDVGYGASAIPGAYDEDSMGELIASIDDVLVLTPEKLDLLVRLQPDLLEDISLVVIDEGHIVGDSERGPKFELLVSRLRTRLPAARFLYMSAVVPDITLQHFAAWLGDAQGYVSANWRPTLLRHAQLDWTGTSGTLRYSGPDVAGAGIEFVPGLIAQKTYEYRSEETRRIRRPKFPNPASKGEIAAELAYTYAPRGPVLIFCMLTDWARSTAAALLRRVELAELAGEEPHPQFRLRDSGRALAVAADWLGEDHDVVRLLRRGIAFHHGRLPSPVREAVEADFRDGRLSALVATTTLAQGVNLPINTVVFHSCRRRDDDGEVRRLPARDYWNIAGRAGRAGHETRGLAIHVVRTTDDRADFGYYVSARDDPEPVVSGMIELLIRLVRERVSSEEVAAKLDSDLLALLVEETSPQDASRLVAETMGSSLFAIQAAAADLPTDPLVRTLSQEAQRIVGEIPDAPLRAIFASTGLSSRSCLTLANHIRDNRTELATMAQGSALEDRLGLTDLFVEALSLATEMEPRSQLEGDERVLRTLWLSGTSMSAIAAELDIDPMSVSQFVEDFYVYRLPWGISGYLRIASALLEDFEPSAETANVAGMIKYGVPTQEAVWAMTAGVPSRHAAILIAGAFVAEASESSPASFRRWLGTLEAEELAERFGLGGVDLDVTTRAILRAHTNEYLTRLDTAEPLLPLECTLRPRRLARQTGLSERVAVGDVLALRRDLASGVHRNGVVALLDGDPLGYLPIAAAQAIAPEMDAGMSVEARVVETVQTPRGTVVNLRLMERAVSE